jgi:hypothetical protein
MSSHRYKWCHKQVDIDEAVTRAQDVPKARTRGNSASKMSKAFTIMQRNQRTAAFSCNSERIGHVGCMMHSGVNAGAGRRFTFTNGFLFAYAHGDVQAHSVALSWQAIPNIDGLIPRSIRTGGGAQQLGEKVRGRA